ncbi:DUF1521 domain-containing protein [Paraburkholderia sediminicola]|uniref:DUF1521 domain-containing protein n=1 Tax=Paraburkholderia sediminicola TaxID=458836 RepID=UPI0038BA5128
MQAAIEKQYSVLHTQMHSMSSELDRSSARMSSSSAFESKTSSQQVKTFSSDFSYSHSSSFASAVAPHSQPHFRRTQFNESTPGFGNDTRSDRCTPDLRGRIQDRFSRLESSQEMKGIHGGFNFDQTTRRVSYHSDSRNELHNHANGHNATAAWSNTAVSGNKSSIDLGNYKVNLNKSDSSILLTDKKTGETTKVWGDPHIDSNGKSSMFKGPLTFDLPGGTKMTVGTQGNGNVTYADRLTITNGNNAYQVNGLSEKNSSPLTVQRTGNGRQLDAQTPDGYSIAPNSHGKGWVDAQTGKAADFTNH